MSTRKTAAKSSTKAEPAAKKATASPAPKKTVVKKTVKETATPAPDDLAEQIAAERAKEAEEKAMREELLKKQKAESNAIQKLKEENKALHRDRTTLKIAVADFKEKYENTKASLENANQATRGWINRGNKWVFAAVPVIVLGVWIFFLSRHNSNLEKTVQDKNTVITGLRDEIDGIRADQSYDSIHAANNDIPKPNIAADVKKKSDREQTINNLNKKADETKDLINLIRDNSRRHAVAESLARAAGYDNGKN